MKLDVLCNVTNTVYLADFVHDMMMMKKNHSEINKMNLNDIMLKQYNIMK